jgi:hypothetical protein
MLNHTRTELVVVSRDRFYNGYESDGGREEWIFHVYSLMHEIILKLFKFLLMCEVYRTLYSIKRGFRLL